MSKSNPMHHNDSLTLQSEVESNVCDSGPYDYDPNEPDTQHEPEIMSVSDFSNMVKLKNGSTVNFIGMFTKNINSCDPEGKNILKGE